MARRGVRRESALEEILQQGVAVLREDRFGVELHALDIVFPVAHAHDFAVVRPRRHFQAGRQRGAFDRQRVVADHCEGAGQAFEDAHARMRDEGSLAMHDLLGADDFTAKRFADGLVAQAHAQYRLLAGEVLEHFHRNACLCRRFRAGRDADAVRVQRFDLLDRDFIVAVDPHVFAQLAEILHDVVGEGVIVVDH